MRIIRILVDRIQESRRRRHNELVWTRFDRLIAARPLVVTR